MQLRQACKFFFSATVAIISIGTGLSQPTTANSTAPILLQKAHTDTVAIDKTLLNSVVAVVNNQPITLDQLNIEVIKTKAQLEASTKQPVADDINLKRQVLQQLINKSIALQMASRQGIGVSKLEVQEAIKKISAQNSISIEQLKLKLKSSDIDYDSYYNTIKDQLIVNKLQQKAVAGKVYIDPNDIQKYIDTHFTDKDTLYKISNILLPLKHDISQQEKAKKIESAKELVQKIKAGEISFNEAAKQYSISSNASSGGDMGWKKVNEIPSIYTNTIKKLSAGEISQPFIANGNIQVVELADKKENPDSKNYVKQYKVRQIVIDTSPVVNDSQAKSKLLRILNSIKNGQKFSTLAKSNSDDLASANSGGSLGWKSPTELPEPISAKLKSIKDEVISKPFKVGNSWQIIQVTGVRNKDNTKEYQKRLALNALFQDNAQLVIKTWMMSLRDSAYIKIIDPNLKIDK